jgi:hypothetical protein
MLKNRIKTAATGAKYTTNIKAVERYTNKHIRPLINLKGVKG